jgi:hypothetical protein
VIEVRLDLDARDPFDVLVAVHPRHHDAAGKAVRLGEGHAVHVEREESVGSEGLGERECVVIGHLVRDEPQRARTGPDPRVREEVAKPDARPPDVLDAPPRHAVEVGDLLDARERAKVGERVRDRPLDRAVDRQPVRGRVDARDRAADRVDPPAGGRDDRLDRIGHDPTGEPHRIAPEKQPGEARPDDPEECSAPEHAVVHPSVVAMDSYARLRTRLWA